MQPNSIKASMAGWISAIMQDVQTKTENDSTGHDYFHALRVMKLSQNLAVDLGIEPYTAMVAGLLHDYFREEEKSHGILHFGPEAIELLRKAFYPKVVPFLGEDAFEAILDAISVHEMYGVQQDNMPLKLNAQILQDADRLDALGAVGIARAFMFGGAHGLPMQESHFDRNYVFNSNMKPCGSVHRHFYEKLLRLPDQMNTLSGKKLALERHAFLKAYLVQFEQELEDYSFG
ncbi:HD domain-containing protein [Metabacillus arenae]|uniref:HD domain-containing protein n=1 Tax=Metabacillus arenae TaxID=2771434 RepID=A0A926NKK0_9BACI|nr:HD domain-containing protein [Metabacillus arenae]MBD1382455.1 HD domain-containing protein [Metabacillus arenae]